jgi:photosystem II stability/assembly factor-like uncharacterized protein
MTSFRSKKRKLRNILLQAVRVSVHVTALFTITFQPIIPAAIVFAEEVGTDQNIADELPVDVVQQEPILDESPQDEPIQPSEVEVPQPETFELFPEDAFQSEPSEINDEDNGQPQPQGSAWHVQASNVTHPLFSIRFRDQNFGTSTGQGPRVLYTTNKGDFWQPATYTTPTLMDHEWVGSRAWFVGPTGTILYFDGQGCSQSSGVSTTLRAVAMVDGIIGYVVGDNGMILKTSNGGNACLGGSGHWIPQTSGVTANLMGADFWDATHGVAVGGSGTILITNDGGLTWQNKSIGAGALNDVQYIDQNRIAAVGLNGRVVVSTNGGASWVTLQTVPTTKDLWGIDVVSGVVWIAGFAGTILSTQDGTTWKTENTGSTEDFYDIEFTTSNHGWVVGTNGTILHYDGIPTVESAFSMVGIGANERAYLTWYVQDPTEVEAINIYQNTGSGYDKVNVNPLPIDPNVFAIDGLVNGTRYAFNATAIVEGRESPLLLAEDVSVTLEVHEPQTLALVIPGVMFPINSIVKANLFALNASDLLGLSFDSKAISSIVNFDETTIGKPALGQGFFADDTQLSKDVSVQDGFSQAVIGMANRLSTGAADDGVVMTIPLQTGTESGMTIVDISNSILRTTQGFEPGKWMNSVLVVDSGVFEDGLIRIDTPTPNTRVNASQASSVVVSGTMLDPAMVSVAVNDVPAVVQGTNFAATLNFSGVGDGVKQIIAIASNGDGTRRDIEIVPIEVDQTAPRFKWITPSDGFVSSDATIKVSGEVDDHGATVNVNGEEVLLTDGEFTDYPVLLSGGSNSVTFTATDEAGNTTSETRTYLYEFQNIVVASPVENQIVYESPIMVTGNLTTVKNTTVTVNGHNAAVDAQGNFSVEIPLDVGRQNVTVRDGIGNEEIIHITFYVPEYRFEFTSQLDQEYVFEQQLTVTGTMQSEAADVTMRVSADGENWTDYTPEKIPDFGKVTTFRQVVTLDADNDLTTIEEQPYTIEATQALYGQTQTMTIVVNLKAHLPRIEITRPGIVRELTHATPSDFSGATERENIISENGIHILGEEDKGSVTFEDDVLEAIRWIDTEMDVGRTVDNGDARVEMKLQFANQKESWEDDPDHPGQKLLCLNKPSALGCAVDEVFVDSSKDSLNLSLNLTDRANVRQTFTVYRDLNDPTHTFATDPEGFTSLTYQDLQSINGALSAHIDGDVVGKDQVTATLLSPMNLSIDATRGKFIELGMKISKANEDDPNPTKARFCFTDCTQDYEEFPLGEMNANETYVIDLHDHPAWTGTQTSFQLVPLIFEDDPTGSGSYTVEISWIKHASPALQSLGTRYTSDTVVHETPLVIEGKNMEDYAVPLELRDGNGEVAGTMKQLGQEFVIENVPIAEGEFMEYTLHPGSSSIVLERFRILLDSTPPIVTMDPPQYSHAWSPDAMMTVTGQVSGMAEYESEPYVLVTVHPDFSEDYIFEEGAQVLDNGDGTYRYTAQIPYYPFTNIVKTLATDFVFNSATVEATAPASVDAAIWIENADGEKITATKDREIVVATGWSDRVTNLEMCFSGDTENATGCRSDNDFVPYRDRVPRTLIREEGMRTERMHLQWQPQQDQPPFTLETAETTIVLDQSAPVASVPFQFSNVEKDDSTGEYMIGEVRTTVSDVTGAKSVIINGQVAELLNDNTVARIEDIVAYPGANTLAVVLEDVLGNSTFTTTDIPTMDRQVEIIRDPGAFTNATDVTFEWTAEMDELGHYQTSLDDRWSGFEASATQQTFAGLTEGEHTFEVRAEGRDVSELSSKENDGGFRSIAHGDFDGDGKDDILVGTQDNPAIGDRAYIYFGNPQKARLELEPANRQEDKLFGYAVAAGDINNDDIDDALVGAPGSTYSGSKTEAGRAFLYLGGGSMDGTLDATYVGDDSPSDPDYQQFGKAVAFVDHNRDTIEDPFIGEPGNTVDSLGKAYLYWGGSLDTIPDIRFLGDAFPNTGFGSAVSGAGDQNSDGIDDFLISSRNFGDGRGQVYLYDGRSIQPFMGPGSWRREIRGEVPNDFFGSGITRAGDVDNDGKEDVLINAPGNDIQALEAGKVVLYYGDDDYFLTPRIDSFFGERSYDYLGGIQGRGMASLGDLNRDGYDDIMIASDGFDHDGDDAGKVYVHYGNAFMDADPEFWMIGKTPGGHLGSAVTGLEDVNGDRVPELGAATSYSIDTQSIVVYKNGWTDTVPTPAATDAFLGETPVDLFGRSVAWADLNGDSNDELIVGAPEDHEAGAGAGKVVIYDGAKPHVTVDEDFTDFDSSKWTVNGEAYWNPEGRFYVTPLGLWKPGNLFLNEPRMIDKFRVEFDYNISDGSGADGLTFAMVENTTYTLNAGGQLGFGGVGGAKGYAVEFDTWANNEHGEFRPHVGVIKDDATNHLATTEPNEITIRGVHHVVITFNTGHVEVDMDNQRVLTTDIASFTPYQGYLGFTAATGGLDDYHIVDNVVMSPLPDAEILGEAAGDKFGASVAGLPDVNGDGKDEMIVGAQWNDSAAQDAGKAYFYYGSSNFDSVPDVTMTGIEVGERLGNQVASVGDVNNDQLDDFMISSFNNVNTGSAFLYYGDQNPQSLGEWDKYFVGSHTYEYFGSAIANAGDLNNDDYDDVIVGSPYYSGAKSSQGRSQVFFGAADMDTVADLTMLGEEANDQFGVSASTVGDVNADGFDDFLVGSHGNSEGGQGAGKAYLFFGGVAPDTGADFTWIGEEVGDQLGFAVGSAGSMDNDNYADIMIGAPSHDGIAENSGKSYLYKGGRLMSDSMNHDEPDATFDGQQQDENLGVSFAVGDRNADGSPDLAIGSQHFRGIGQVHDHDLRYQNSVASNRRTFTVDRTPPVLMVNDPVVNENGDVTLSFSATDNFTDAEEMQYAWRADSSDFSNPSWQTNTTNVTIQDLGTGGHTIYVQAKDLAGNVSGVGSKTVSVISLDASLQLHERELPNDGDLAGDDNNVWVEWDTDHFNVDKEDLELRYRLCDIDGVGCSDPNAGWTNWRTQREFGTNSLVVRDDVTSPDYLEPLQNEFENTITNEVPTQDPDEVFALDFEKQVLSDTGDPLAVVGNDMEIHLQTSTASSGVQGRGQYFNRRKHDQYFVEVFGKNGDRDFDSTFQSATMMGWLNFEEVNGYDTFFDFGEHYGTKRIRVRTDQTGKTLTFHLKDRAGTDHEISAPNMVQQNQWMHVAAMCGERGMRFYVNGTLIREIPEVVDCLDDLEIPANDRVHFIGLDLDNPHYLGFVGRMDDVKFFSRALDEDEVLEQMNEHNPYAETLEAHYDFDRGAGTTLIDQTEHTHDGSFVGTPEWSTNGIFGQSVAFNSNDDQIVVPHDDVLGGGSNSPLTLELFFYPERIPQTSILVSKSKTSDFIDYELRLEGSQLIFFTKNQGPEIYLNSLDLVREREWNHAAVTIDPGKEINLFLNGVRQPHINNPILFSGSASNLVLGNRSWSQDNRFNGSLDEFFVHHRTLSAAEILQRYRSWTHNVPNNTLLQLRFNDSTRDDSAFHNDGQVSTGGASLYEQGMRGSALKLDGTTFVTVPDRTSVSLDQGWFFGAWVKIAEVANQTIFFSKDGNEMELALTSDDHLKLMTKDLSVDVQIDQNDYLNQWMHLSGRFIEGGANDSLTLYKDGIELGTSTGDSGASNQWTGQLRIGNDLDNNFLKGSIDDPIFLRRLPQGNEIATLASTPTEIWDQNQEFRNVEEAPSYRFEMEAKGPKDLETAQAQLTIQDRISPELTDLIGPDATVTNNTLNFKWSADDNVTTYDSLEYSYQLEKQTIEGYAPKKTTRFEPLTIFFDEGKNAADTLFQYRLDPEQDDPWLRAPFGASSISFGLDRYTFIEDFSSSDSRRHAAVISNAVQYDEEEKRLELKVPDSQDYDFWCGNDEKPKDENDDTYTCGRVIYEFVAPPETNFQSVQLASTPLATQNDVKYSFDGGVTWTTSSAGVDGEHQFYLRFDLAHDAENVGYLTDFSLSATMVAAGSLDLLARNVAHTIELQKWTTEIDEAKTIIEERVIPKDLVSAMNINLAVGEEIKTEPITKSETLIAWTPWASGETASSRIFEGLSEGQYNLQVIARDAFGNESRVEGMISTIDSTPIERVEMISPQSGSILHTLDDVDLKIRVSTEIPKEVRVDDQTISVPTIRLNQEDPTLLSSMDFDFTIPAPTQSEQGNIQIVTLDQAGNVGEVRGTLLHDILLIDTPVDGDTIDQGTVTVSGRYRIPGAQITVTGPLNTVQATTLFDEPDADGYDHFYVDGIFLEGENEDRTNRIVTTLVDPSTGKTWTEARTVNVTVPVERADLMVKEKTASDDTYAKRLVVSHEKAVLFQLDTSLIHSDQGLRIEWDFNGDGQFELSELTNNDLVTKEFTYGIETYAYPQVRVYENVQNPRVWYSNRATVSTYRSPNGTMNEHEDESHLVDIHRWQNEFGEEFIAFLDQDLNQIRFYKPNDLNVLNDYVELEFVQGMSPAIRQPGGIWVMNEGINPDRIRVADGANDRIVEIRKSGQDWIGTVVVPDISSPRSIVMDEDGNILVSHENQISIFDAQGKLWKEIRQFESFVSSDDQLLSPNGLAVDKDFFYVADTGNNRVVKFTRSGEFRDIIGTGFLNGPEGVSVDSTTGYVYATNTLGGLSSSVERFNEAGIHDLTIQTIKDAGVIQQAVDVFWDMDASGNQFLYVIAEDVSGTPRQKVMINDSVFLSRTERSGLGARVNVDQVFFTREDELYAVNMDTSNLQRLFSTKAQTGDNGMIREFSVSPDLSNIVLVAQKSTQTIYEYDTAQNTLRELYTSPSGAQIQRPVYSPDGRRIAFAMKLPGVGQRYRLYYFDLDVENPGTPISITSYQTRDLEYPVWTPMRDSETKDYRLVYMSNEDGDYDLYTQKLVGGEVGWTKLTNNNVDDKYPHVAQFWSARGMGTWQNAKVLYHSNNEILALDINALFEEVGDPETVTSGSSLSFPTWSFVGEDQYIVYAESSKLWKVKFDPDLGHGLPEFVTSGQGINDKYPFASQDHLTNVVVEANTSRELEMSWDIEGNLGYTIYYKRVGETEFKEENVGSLGSYVLDLIARGYSNPEGQQFEVFVQGFNQQGRVIRDSQHEFITMPRIFTTFNVTVDPHGSGDHYTVGLDARASQNVGYYEWWIDGNLDPRSGADADEIEVTFPKAGSHTVRLEGHESQGTPCDDDQDICEDREVVVIEKNLNPSFTYEICDAGQCGPEKSVKFISSSTGNIACTEWKFQDGLNQYGPIAYNDYDVVNQSRTYDVTLTLFHESCPPLEDQDTAALSQKIDIEADELKALIDYTFVDADADEDGLLDLVEAGMEPRPGVHPDPNDEDSDDDGFLDGGEVSSRTDPTDEHSYPADADRDHLDDIWEVRYFQDVESVDGVGDADDDGIVDFEEYLRDTDPTNADSDGDGFPDGSKTVIFSGSNSKGTKIDWVNAKWSGTDASGSTWNALGLSATHVYQQKSGRQQYPVTLEISRPVGESSETVKTTTLINIKEDPFEPRIEYRIGDDQDHDGLTAIEETTNPNPDDRTDPYVFDSDGDEWADGAEIRSGTDPNDDGDVPDDTDLDKLGDDWENNQENFGNLITSNGGTQDSDGDGFLDVEEYHMGTFPSGDTGKTSPGADLQDRNLVIFDAQRSLGSNIEFSNAKWDFGDQSPEAFGPVVSHSYPISKSVKRYPVTLTLTRHIGNNEETRAVTTVISVEADVFEPKIDYTFDEQNRNTAYLTVEKSVGANIAWSETTWCIESLIGKQSICNLPKGPNLTYTFSPVSSNEEYTVIATLYRYGAKTQEVAKTPQKISIAADVLQPWIIWQNHGEGRFMFDGTKSHGANIDHTLTLWEFDTGARANGPTALIDFPQYDFATNHVVTMTIFRRDTDGRVVEQLSTSQNIPVEADPLEPKVTNSVKATKDNGTLVEFDSAKSTGVRLNSSFKWTFNFPCDEQHGQTATCVVPLSSDEQSYHATLEITRRDSLGNTETEDTTHTFKVAGNKVKAVSFTQNHAYPFERIFKIYIFGGEWPLLQATDEELAHAGLVRFDGAYTGFGTSGFGWAPEVVSFHVPPGSRSSENPEGYEKFVVQPLREQIDQYHDLVGNTEYVKYSPIEGTQATAMLHDVNATYFLTGEDAFEYEFPSPGVYYVSFMVFRNEFTGRATYSTYTKTVDVCGWMPTDPNKPEEDQNYYCGLEYKGAWDNPDD